MELLLNELSFEGQYSSIDQFASTALRSAISVLNDLASFGELLLKTRDVFSAQITTDNTFSDILSTPPSLFRDEIRKFKIALQTLALEPYWEDSISQYADSYTWNDEDILGSALAESCERDKIVMSFLQSRFEDPVLEVYRNHELVEIVNILRGGELLEYLWGNSLITFEKYVTTRFVGGKLNFTKFIDNTVLDAVQFNEQKLYIDTFRKFEAMSWIDIGRNDGLEYKPFTGSLPGFNGTQNLSKFRASQKIRCHGYREGDQFYVLHLEVDHRLSDNG